MYTKEKLLETGYFIDNEYLEKYCSLLELNRDRRKEKSKTHQHHIIPRHYYTLHMLNVDNSVDNLVNLLYKDHMLAHMYMSGCTSGRNRYWNLYAVSYMTGKTGITCEELERDLPEYQRLYEEAISAAPNHRKGVEVSAETLERMREAQRQRVAMYGSHSKDTRWMHKEGKEYMIPLSEVEMYLEEGFELGRVFRHTPQWKAEQALRSHNRVVTDEFRLKMSRIAKGQVHTVERRAKASQAKKEYFRTHPGTFTGKKHTDVAREKNRLGHVGRRTISKDGVIKCVWPDELDFYINQGFQLGRKS